MAGAAAPRTSIFEIRVTTDLLYDIASDAENKKNEDFRRALRSANPGISSFDLFRSGDEITLVFGFREGTEAAEFRLFGSRHDYYRMAMGVRLEETLQTMAKPDPSLQPAGVERRDKNIVLRVRYSWPAAREPKPEPIPSVAAPVQPAGSGSPERRAEGEEVRTKPERSKVQAASPDGRADPRDAARQLQAPAVEASKPSGAQVPVELPASRTGAKPGKILVSEAQPPEAAPPQPPTPAEQAESAYREALEQGTLRAFVRFLEMFPRAPQAGDVRQKADKLRQEAAYKKALERNDAAGYAAFLEHFPDSPYGAEVKSRLKALEDARRQAATAEARRVESYSETRRLDTPEAYRAYLAAYPDSADSKQARHRLAAIEADDAAFEQARGSEAGLQKYLAENPRGRHAPEAEAALRARAVEKPEPAEAAPARGRLTLVARRVSTPPEVDGAADDPCWADAPELVVPLQGGQGSQLWARAVHDGKSVYLLVRWVDSTRDAVYRPWVWDAERKVYRPSDQLDDALAVALYSAQNLSGSCMLGGEEQESDLWLWRAFWSELSGFAEDSRIQVSRARIPRSNSHPAADGRGQVWIRRTADEGSAGWKLFVPIEFLGDSVSSYQPVAAAGSRGEVRARGRWAASDGGGRWCVEFARALDTRHPDDVPARIGRPQPISFAVYDKADGQQHAKSPLIWLEPKEK